MNHCKEIRFYSLSFCLYNKIYRTSSEESEVFMSVKDSMIETDSTNGPIHEQNAIPPADS